jgi:Na+/melibiose symporter-like transporter
MTRTTPTNLVLLAVLGGGVMWFTETALAASGRAVILPPFTLGVALLLIGVIIVAMALPVRRVSRGVAHARVDPFYATRVLMLAKASSLSGALLGGGGLGIVGYLLSRSVVASPSAVTMSVAAAVGAILLLVAGLVAEHMCSIPPDDKKRDDGAPDTRGRA